MAASDATGVPASVHVGRPRRPRRRRLTAGREAGAVLGLGAAVAILLRLFAVQAYAIPSGSMEPLLRPGDRVIVLSAGTGEVRRGDVVVFDGAGLFAPTPAERSAWQALLDGGGGALAGSDRDFVKRVIGLPGERITCCDASGRITVDGVPLDEPYVHPGDVPSELAFDVVVPQGRLWLMGDHRSDSADSRAHLGDPGGGMVPVSRVIGRVLSVAWPMSRWDGVGRWEYGDGAAASGNSVPSGLTEDVR